MGVSGRDYMQDRPLDHGGFAAAPWTFWMGIGLIPLWLVFAISWRSGVGPNDVFLFLSDNFLLRQGDLARGHHVWSVATTGFLSGRS